MKATKQWAAFLKKLSQTYKNNSKLPDKNCLEAQGNAYCPVLCCLTTLSLFGRITDFEKINVKSFKISFL